MIPSGPQGYSGSVWRLGPYRLEPTNFRLERDGDPVPLQRRPFDLLLYLVAYRDRTVSREELLREVWGGVAVAPGAVSTAVYELRVALGDLERPPAERWIHTVRARGFRYRGPAKEVDPAEAGADPVPFVGRGSALSLLHRRIRDARDGHGGLLVVEGRAGMGKTRLVAELAGGLRDASLHTVGCEVGAPPLWPWTQLLGELAASPAALAPFDEPEPAGDRGAERPRLHFERVDAITAALSEAARTRPVVVVIEDLHWADPSSLSVLQSLAPRLATRPVLVVATERGEVDEGEAASSILHSSHVEKLRLEPLDVPDLYPVVGAVIGRVPSPELIGWMQQHGQGVPLMIRELAERIASEGEALVDVPKVAQRIFARRFDSLGEASRKAIGIAALCGIRFDAPLIETAAGDALASDRAWIREGLRAGVLVPVRGHPLRFAFRHALLREAAEGLLDPDEVPEWHRRIADAIERQRPDASGEALSRLARHSAASVVTAADAAGSLRHALKAARRAARVLDWTEVAVHTAHVLQWIDFVPPSRARDAQEIEAALLRCAAIASGSGHVEETEAWIERIRPLLERSGDARSRALAEGFRFANARCAGDHAVASACAERLASAEGLDEVASCWRVGLASLAGAFADATTDAAWGDALPASPRFLDFARHCGRDPGIDRLGLSAFAFWALGDDATAVGRADRAVTWAEQSGDTRGRIWALFLLCFLHELRRDWASLRRWGPEIDRASQRSGVSSWLGLGAGLRLWAEAREGADHRAALRQLGAILFERARASNTTLTSPIQLLASRVFHFAGDRARAEQAVLEGIAWSERTDECFLLAELHRQHGALLSGSGSALAARRRGLEVARAQPHRVSEIRAIADLVEDGTANAHDRARLVALQDACGATLGAREAGRLERALGA